MDFRDQVVKEALDRTIGPWRPEKSRRARIRRVLVVVALTLVSVLGFWAVLHVSSPKGKKPPQSRPIAVELVAPPGR
jgi:hypothetical protein